MRMQLTISPETSQLRSARRIIEGWAAAHGVAADSLCLIATELLANAIAVTPAGEAVELVLELQDQDVTLSVSDAGPSGFSGDDIRMVGAESIRGRGLHLVNSLSNRLTVDRVADRTVVTAHQYRRMLGPLVDEARSAGNTNGSANGGAPGPGSGGAAVRTDAERPSP